MEQKETKERDFHHGEGHEIPFFIKIAWTILISWGLYYFFTYSIPDLQKWIK